ncbi:quinolinate synthetase [Alicyclobacillus sacchari]|uniref:Quinolinate synthase n=1 Tax=Alicyclobacillus sacchari TaxID=392010 RepID=A0A4R8LUN9_9BACL|nr:quinolinate synthase NadA [Alicyclobacillus sacchari]TDY51404.1 quinolinate synthetase [Alicyclobacillus sacchari]GMA56743.1 quinolinate synthase [Alicyclobacillus sacchari]
MAMTIEQGTLLEQIRVWKEKRNALILAHNYELPEVQDVADILGDSLALARAAAQTAADVIVLCGVHFMAETAAILNPEKTVLLPDAEAGCSLADSITADQLRAWKQEHPGAVVVSYVNTSAEVKAESDYCCTSANAVEVVNSIPADKEVLFCPDMFLGSYVKRMTGRENMHIWLGECHVHAGIAPADISDTLSAHPQAELLIHPECGCSTSNMYLLAEGQLPADRTHVLSTSGMLQRARTSSQEEFIVATEVGILHQMERQNPHKRFIPANRKAICPFMKMITLEKVLASLVEMRTVIAVPAETAKRARIALERMVEIG